MAPLDGNFKTNTVGGKTQHLLKITVEMTEMTITVEIQRPGFRRNVEDPTFDHSVLPTTASCWSDSPTVLTLDPLHLGFPSIYETMKSGLLIITTTLKLSTETNLEIWSQSQARNSGVHSIMIHVMICGQILLKNLGLHKGLWSEVVYYMGNRSFEKVWCWFWWSEVCLANLRGKYLGG